MEHRPPWAFRRYPTECRNFRRASFIAPSIRRQLSERTAVATDIIFRLRLIRSAQIKDLPFLLAPRFNHCGISGAAVAQALTRYSYRDAANDCHRRVAHQSRIRPANRSMSPAGMLSPGAPNIVPVTVFLRITTAGYCRPLISKVAGMSSPSVGRRGAGNGIVG
jgi:hypothetical protein